MRSSVRVTDTLPDQSPFRRSPSHRATGVLTECRTRQAGLQLSSMTSTQPTRASLQLLDDANTAPILDAVILLCSDTMTCECLLCEDERATRVQNGIRPSVPIPMRKAA